MDLLFNILNKIALGEIMKFHINYFNVEQLKKECVVVGVFENKKLSIAAKYLDEISKGCINKYILSGELEGKVNQFLLLYNVPHIFSDRVLLIGCGKESDFNEDIYRKILLKTMYVLNSTSATEAVLFINNLFIDNKNMYWKIRVALEVIEKFSYQFNYFKSIYKIKRSTLHNIFFNIYQKSDIFFGEMAIQHGVIINQGIKETKDLANLPPNICTPNYLKLKVKNLEQNSDSKLSIEIVDEKLLNMLGMNAYLAVSKGSKNKPYMSLIKYNGLNNNMFQSIILIGKGVTFDSGGLSIKSSKCMDEMKYDMSGAAVVYGIMYIVIKLKLPLNIIGILASCENMPGGGAFRPGDIIKTMSGATVEVLDTDAEGRLILCDILTYVERFQPSIVIDIATLTGACVTALGNSISGLFSNCNLLVKDIIKASKQTGDTVWQLPIFDKYKDTLHSNFADLANISNTKSAGAITAACFLSHFVKKYHWAHIDIAGTSWVSGKNKGSTGRPILLLIQFLLNKSGLNFYS